MCGYDFDEKPLVEVFSVRVRVHGGEAPTGTVSVFDGKRGQIIYRRSPDQPHRPSYRYQNSGELPLTGPYRAVSADGCVAIVLDLQGHRQNKASSSSSSSSYVAEILLDVYNKNTRYDETITHDDGFVQVKYALLSDAAEAIVEVKLLRPRASGTVRGTIVAGTDLGEVVLFDDDDDGETTTSVGTQELAVILPLARSVVAVPLTSLLTIDVDLRLDGNETLRESVVSSVPNPGSEEVCCSDSGEVEVKITWLD